MTSKGNLTELEAERARNEAANKALKDNMIEVASKLEKTEAANRALTAKLGAQSKAPALTTPQEQFMPPPVAAPLVVQPPPDMTTSIFAAGDVRNNGLRPVARPRSCFDGGFNPTIVKNLFDYDTMLREAEIFPRSAMADEQVIRQ